MPWTAYVAAQIFERNQEIPHMGVYLAGPDHVPALNTRQTLTNYP